MKKFAISSALMTLVFGLGAVSFAQDPPPPPQDGQKGMRKGMRGPGGPGMRDGGRRGKHGMRGGHGKRGMGHRGGQGMMFGAIEQLDLTDAQKIKLFDLKKKHFAEMKAGKEAGRQKFEGMKGKFQGNEAERKKMHDLMTAKRFGTITPEQQKELDAHMAQRKTEMEKHMADRKAAMEARRKKGEEFHQQLLSILTPEQKAQLQKMHEEKMKQMQERMKNRPRRGPGGPPMGPGGPPPGGEGNF